MRGMPKIIQTRADLQNLFALAQAGEAGVGKAALAERIRGLLAMQYHRVPILSTENKTVTTMYFPEAQEGGTTEEGLTLTTVTHTNDPESTGQFSETVITLSKSPSDKKTLSLFMEDNFLTRHDFDLAEMNYMLGVLENA